MTSTVLPTKMSSPRSSPGACRPPRLADPESPRTSAETQRLIHLRVRVLVGSGRMFMFEGGSRGNEAENENHGLTRPTLTTKKAACRVGRPLKLLPAHLHRSRPTTNDQSRRGCWKPFQASGRSQDHCKKAQDTCAHWHGRRHTDNWGRRERQAMLSRLQSSHTRVRGSCRTSAGR